MKQLLFCIALSCFFLIGCKQVTQDQTQDNSRRQERTERENNDQQDAVGKDYIVPKWGTRFYKAHKGKIEAIEHIWLRHNYNSTYDNVSRFAKEYSTRQDLKKLITAALKQAKKNEIQKEARGQKTVTTTMDNLTGLSQRGKPTYKIRIHLDDKDFVETAYPY